MAYSFLVGEWSKPVRSCGGARDLRAIGAGLAFRADPRQLRAQQHPDWAGFASTRGLSCGVAGAGAGAALLPPQQPPDFSTGPSWA
jgi:hypothetical protein